MSLSMILVAGLVFAAVFGGLVLVMNVLQKRQAPAVAEGPGQKRVTGKLDPKLAALEVKLRLAGLPFTPEVYQKRVVMAAMTSAVLGMAMGGFATGGLLFGGLLAFGTLKGGDFYLKFKHGQRLQEFVDQFADALGVMANGVKSGQTVLQTLETIVEDFNDPLREEVAEVLQEIRMGYPMDESLQHWVDRMPCEDLEIAVTALIVQRQTGGNISEILETLATTIRERNKLHKQISALTSQGRMSGVVMSLLPIGLFVAMYLIAPARMGLLISHPIGLIFTALGVVMIGLGSYFIKRIVTIEV